MKTGFEKFLNEEKVSEFLINTEKNIIKLMISLKMNNNHW